MLDTIASVIAVALGVHIVAKFACFALPNRRRRVEFDKQYGQKPAATNTSDRVVMGVAVAIAAVLLSRGVKPVSFIGGLWIGATLIQLYFHQFHRSVAREGAAPPETDQGDVVCDPRRAGRAWPQVLMLTAPAVFSLKVLF